MSKKKNQCRCFVWSWLMLPISYMFGASYLFDLLPDHKAYDIPWYEFPVFATLALGALGLSILAAFKISEAYE